MKAANDELEQDRMMGRLGRLKMEISSDEEDSEDSDSEDDSSEGDEGSSDDDSSDSESSQKNGSDNMKGMSGTSDADKGKSRKHKKAKAPYIEMVCYFCLLFRFTSLMRYPFENSWHNLCYTISSYQSNDDPTSQPSSL